MIIGNGDLASVLPKRDDLIFFASGVSNSQETNEEEYKREIKLLMDQPKHCHIVYFSSLAIFYSNTRYTRHKLEMEMVAKVGFDHSTIVRIGNITWGKNPKTLINFLRRKIGNKEAYTVEDVYRYVVDKEEFLHWIKLIPTFIDCEINIPGKRMKVGEIVEAIKNGKLR